MSTNKRLNFVIKSSQSLEEAYVHLTRASINKSLSDFKTRIHQAKEDYDIVELRNIKNQLDDYTDYLHEMFLSPMRHKDSVLTKEQLSEAMDLQMELNAY